MKVTLFLPVLNEVEGLKAVMPSVKREWVDEILVIDGGSTDGSYEYCEKMGYRMVRQQTKGLVGAYQEGIPIAKGDVIITFSPDGNSLAALIPPLIEKMKEGYDMVVASRYYGGAKSEDDDPVTAFGNWLFTTMIKIVFGSKTTDSLVIFRAWRKEIFSLCTVDAKAAGMDVQMTIVAAKYKLRVADIPGDEPKRIGGVRKMDPLKNGFGILVLIVKEFFAKKIKFTTTAK